MKLTDYSGGFLAGLRLEDLSRDSLLELIRVYSRLYMALDGFWYLSIKDEVSNDTAVACDIRCWQRQARYEMSRITKRFNITGNDVVALMKAFQLTPWYWTVQGEIEIESPKKGTLTVLRCPTLDALEKEGEGREKQICTVVEQAIYGAYAAFFNPQMKVTCLRAPPRDSPDEIACRWEFRLE